MSAATRGKMLLTWSYWPSDIPVSDPKTKLQVVDSLCNAIEISNMLKKKHGDDLLYVDVTIRLIDLSG